MNKIAIQGGNGSFHEQAARQFYGDDINILPCITFEQLFTSVTENNASAAIMAIENSIAGDLLPNYSLLYKYNKQIKGEIILQIHQNLMALPGQTINDITEVRSHYMAIAQTRAFFSMYPHIRLTESDDTALSAKEIADYMLAHIGVIASANAAKLYNLKILNANIETNKHNYTRFLILDDNIHVDKEHTNKASLFITPARGVDSLAKALTSLSEMDLTISKIQTIPIVGKPWQYRFYLDIEYRNYETYEKGIQEIRPYMLEIQMIGEYKIHTL